MTTAGGARILSDHLRTPLSFYPKYTDCQKQSKLRIFLLSPSDRLSCLPLPKESLGAQRLVLLLWDIFSCYILSMVHSPLVKFPFKGYRQGIVDSCVGFQDEKRQAINRLGLSGLQLGKRRTTSSESSLWPRAKDLHPQLNNFPWLSQQSLWYFPTDNPTTLCLNAIFCREG
jgi:hypothetical protein